MLQRATPSAVASPDLAIAVEPLGACLDELLPLLVRYHREGKDAFPLDPDWKYMLGMEATGNLRLLSVRHEDTMIGFAINLIATHPLYRSLVHGTTAWVWLDPAYRDGWSGYTFLKRNLDFLKECGCVRVFIADRSERLDPVYQRLGYKRMEVAYERVL